MGNIKIPENNLPKFWVKLVKILSEVWGKIGNFQEVLGKLWVKILTNSRKILIIFQNGPGV